MENEIVLDSYVYITVTGNSYSPVFKNGKWFLCSVEMSLLNLAVLLQIEDDEELTMLALTYGV